MGALIDRLRARFGETIRDAHDRLGDETVVVAREDALDFFRALRDEPEFRFDFLMDLTAVDFLGRAPRFEVVAHLFSLAKKQRLRVRVPLDEASAAMPSLTPLWKSANWLEREVYDLYGIRFEGHPDLRRILMYPEFEGHPLRKDYPVMKRQPLIPERDPIENPWPSRSSGVGK